MKEIEYKTRIIKAGERLGHKGLLIATGGNLSVRISENEVLITASGVCKYTLEPKQITKVDMKGKIISGMKPALDIAMHLVIYKNRPAVKAIVHAHPPFITGISMTDYKFDKITLPEVLFELGEIVVTEYALSTTDSVAEVVEKALLENPESKALVLAAHGAITFGDSIMEASYKMETLEMFAKATIVSKIIGNERTLTENEINNIKRIINKLSNE